MTEKENTNNEALDQLVKLEKEKIIKLKSIQFNLKVLTTAFIIFALVAILILLEVKNTIS
jgi:hypothetical protein